MSRRARLLSASVLLAAAAAACAAREPTPESSASVRPAEVTAPGTSLDDALAREWAARGIATPAPADDATFLRRASVDVLGRIPTEEEVRGFLADPDAERRAHAIDRMLASPEHATRLARFWEDVLLGPETRKSQVDRGALRRWLRDRFAAGEGWDTIVRGLVTASGTNGAGGNAMARELAPDAERAADEQAADVNGAVNWMLRHRKSPQDIAGTASRAFLGVQIQCAQCHDHKTEAWKQSDFESFAASFARVRVRVVDKGRVFDVSEGDGVNRRLLRSDASRGMATAAPRALDGTPLAGEGSPRERLAAWITSRDNPWTRRAFVNRVWARYLGMGFVEPVDDFRPTQPPVAPEILDALAERFERRGWSVQALEREILLSSAYGAAAVPMRGDVQDARWSSFALRAMDEDALVDSFFVAVDADRRFARLEPERAAKRKAAIRRGVALTFDEDAESNATHFDGTIQQALMLMNADAVNGAIEARGGLAGDVAERAAEDPDGALTTLWLRTLSRPPSAAELAKARAASGGALTRRDVEDVFWSLLNASEFAFVH